MKTSAAKVGHCHYSAPMVFLLLCQCNGGWGSSIGGNEKGEHVAFNRNYTGLYFDPGNFLKFNGIAQALDESGLHSLLHKINSRFDQIMVPFHFPPPFDERFSNDFVPEAVARYNSALSKSSPSPYMKIIIWCRVHDWDNETMIHSRIQRLRKIIWNANHIYFETVKSVILELNGTADISAQNYALFRNSFYFCAGSEFDNTIKFGIQLRFMSSPPKSWVGLQILSDELVTTAYISEYEPGDVYRLPADTVNIFMRHFNHYKQLAESLNKTIEMGFLTSWPDTDDIGQVNYGYLVEFWKRMHDWAEKSEVQLIFRQAFDTPLWDEPNSISDGWWRLVPNSSYLHPSQFVFVEKQSLIGRISDENNDFYGNLTWLRSETHFSRDHVGVGFRPNVFRPAVGKPDLYTESSILSLLQQVSTKFSKIFISAPQLSENDEGLWIPSLAKFNRKYNKNMQVMMTFDESTVDKEIKWSTEANRIAPMTVTHLCYVPSILSAGSAEDIFSHIAKKSTELKRFRLGIKVNVVICNDRAEFGKAMRLVDSYVNLLGADAIYIEATLTSELTKLGVDRVLPMVTAMFENCVKEVNKYFGSETRNVQVTFLTGWVIYDGDHAKDLLQFVRFWEQINKWAVRSSTTVLFSSAFDIQTIDDGPSTRSTYGWWRLVEKDPFSETINDYIFEDKKQAALKLAEIKLLGRSNLSSVEMLVIPVTIIIVATLLIIMLTICFLLKSRYSNNLTETEIAELFNGRGTGDVLGNDESIARINKISHHELSKTSLIIDEESPCLGSGAFAKVCRGTVMQAPTGEPEKVAIKMANKEPCLTTTLRSLMFEIKMLSFLGKHPHIVELIGACTSELKKRRIFLVLELCDLGSLRSYLIECRTSIARLAGREEVFDESDTQPGPSCGVNETELDESLAKDMSRWAGEIASGMAFIASKFIVHLDIATRNILLTAEKVAKITDFGLSRQLYDYQTYVKQEKEPLPWRWMAPESLRNSTFTEKSDVWGFGVLLWEIYSLGGEPYYPLQSFDFNFLDKLEKGLIKLDRPIYNQDGMYSIMLCCWATDPVTRPAFSELVEKLCPNESQTGCIEANDETQQPTFHLPLKQINGSMNRTTCACADQRSNSALVRFVWLLVAIILLGTLLTISIITYNGQNNALDDDRTSIPTRAESGILKMGDNELRNPTWDQRSLPELNGYDQGDDDFSNNVTDFNVHALADIDQRLNKCSDYNESKQWMNSRGRKDKALGRKMFNAIDREDEDAISLLLMLGADINVENEFAQSPLIRAAEETRARENKSSGLKIIKYLIENGADGHVVSKTGTFFHSLLLSNLTFTEFDDITTYLILGNMSYVFNTPGGSRMATPLQLAVMIFEVDAPILLMLFQNGVNFNITDGDGNSILTYLVSAKRNVSLLSYVLEFGVNANHLNKFNQSALHHAAQFGHRDGIKYLVQLKLDINAQDNEGRTPLHLAVLSLHRRSWNILDTVRVLTQYGAKGTIKDQQGNTPLAYLLGINNVLDKDQIIQLIQNAKGLDEDLIAAIVDKNEEDVKELIKLGADVNYLYDHHTTPLIKAALCTGDKSICLKIIKHLVENGADAMAKVFQNVTFLHALVAHKTTLTLSQFHDITKYITSKNMTALFNQPGYFSGTYPLHAALSNIQFNATTLSLLDEVGLNFNVVSSAKGWSVLMFALAGNQSIECISRLVALGADVNMINVKNQSCLHRAAVIGSVNYIEYFLQHNLSINAQDVDGMTPLHLATYIARRGSIFQRVAVLIQNGADVTIKDRFGEIPLFYAKLNPNILDRDEVVLLLSDVG